MKPLIKEYSWDFKDRCYLVSLLYLQCVQKIYSMKDFIEPAQDITYRSYILKIRNKYYFNTFPNSCYISKAKGQVKRI